MIVPQVAQDIYNLIYLETFVKMGEHTSKRLTYLIKWPCIVETALPDLIHSTLRGLLVWTVRISHDRQYSTSSNAGLWGDISLRMYRARHHVHTWCCLVKEKVPLCNSRAQEQSPLKLFARILQKRRVVMAWIYDYTTDVPRYTHDIVGYSSPR